MSRTSPTAPAPAKPQGHLEPQVRGESIYDQVTSLLMAIVVGALLVVGWLTLIYATNQAYASRVTSPLEIVDVFGGGGKPRRHPELDREDRGRRGRRCRPGFQQ